MHEHNIPNIIEDESLGEWFTGDPKANAIEKKGGGLPIKEDIGTTSNMKPSMERLIDDDLSDNEHIKNIDLEAELPDSDDVDPDYKP